jgi:ATP-dependent DNA helicase RecG
VQAAVLREAMLNAVCHKQQESCIPVRVSVYEDCLYVANVGVLQKAWIVNNLLGKQ